MPTPEELWLSRYAALGKAQSRYLYLLLLVTAYFLALGLSTRTDAAYGSKPIGVSSLGLELPPSTLLLFGPVLISILLLAILGSLKAAKRAHSELERLLGAERVNESIDPVPNLIDLAVYDLAQAPSPGRAAGAASYPLVLTAAFGTAVYLAASIMCSAQSSLGHRVFTILGALLWVPVAWRLVLFWSTRVQGIRSAFKYISDRISDLESAG